MKVQGNWPVSSVLAGTCLLIAAVFGQANSESLLRTGTFHGRPVSFQPQNGLAIVEGDIVLAPLSQIENQSVTNPLEPRLDAAIFLPATTSVWPVGQSIAEIPYRNTSGSLEVETAVQQFNQTFGDPVSGSVRWVPWAGQSDYVVFDFQLLLNSYCTGHSSIGRIGGAQSIAISGVGCVSVVLHEMGHAAGLLHEHNRQDRASYVGVNWANVPGDSITRAQYTQAVLSGQDVGLFDYSSIMIYDYTIAGLDPHLTNITTIPRGIVLRPVAFFSASDIDTIRRIYGPFNRFGVTVTTNPPGLQTLVDGRPTTGPSVLNFPINSTHQLDIGTAIQAVKGLTTTYYQFARWNDTVSYDPLSPPVPAHSITVLPGDNSALYPKIMPRNSTYVANFIKLNPGWLTSPSRPSADAGSVTILESPVIIGKAQYHAANAPVTVTATPKADYSFYCWQDGQTASINFIKPGCLSVSGSANPRQVSIDVARNRTVAALFTRNPVTLITTIPPGLSFKVDGVAYTGDNAFAQDLDLDWIGNPHSLAALASQPAQTADVGALLWFTSWTIDDTPYSLSQETQLSIGSIPPKRIAANYTLAFPLTVSQNATFSGNSGYSCAGSFAYSATPPPAVFSSTPPTPPMYFDQTSVNVTALPRKGWYFTGWDDSTLKNPATVVMDGSKQLVGSFNTDPSALAIAGLYPSALIAIGLNVDLTVSGSGFTPNTNYCLYNPRATTASRCGATTFISSAQVIVHVGADLLVPGRSLELEMQNDDGQSCQVRSTRAILPVQ